MKDVYRTHIYYATKNAPIIPAEERTDPSQHIYAAFRDLADTDEVSFTGEDDSRPTKIIVPTLNHLATLERELHAAYNTPLNNLGEKMEHEADHVRAAQIVGAKAILFGVKFWRAHEAGQSSPTLYSQPFTSYPNLKVPKLGLAAMSAHPLEPSDDDINDLVALGYEGGVDEVGFRATAHNDAPASTNIIPVPLSYRPSGKVHIL